MDGVLRQENYKPLQTDGKPSCVGTRKIRAAYLSNHLCHLFLLFHCDAIFHRTGIAALLRSSKGSIKRETRFQSSLTGQSSQVPWLASTRLGHPKIKTRHFLCCHILRSALFCFSQSCFLIIKSFNSIRLLQNHYDLHLPEEQRCASCDNRALMPILNEIKDIETIIFFFFFLQSFIHLMAPDALGPLGNRWAYRGQFNSCQAGPSTLIINCIINMKLHQWPSTTTPTQYIVANHAIFWRSL